ncbi:integrin beta-1-binding protein 1 isoform X3 [Melanerpes formicivorus]|uniref:integrin beta-1-binding protein 1 isoform X3 n=1 Tax=Melanerpes formicivorus TaxID=211600 RepID=UPI00358F055B
MFRKGKKRHSSSSSQSSEISTKSKSVDSSLGGLSRSSTVASLDTDSTKSSDGKLPFVPGEEEFIMGVSKYGIKVSTSDQYEPAGPQDHRRRLGGVQPLGLSVQQPGASPSHLQSVIHSLRLSADVREVLMPAAAQQPCCEEEADSSPTTGPGGQGRAPAWHRVLGHAQAALEGTIPASASRQGRVLYFT